MAQKSLLITGCSSGIGYASAHFMRDRGWRVFPACRKVEDVARLREEGFEAVRIDYADTDSILNGLAEVLEATGGTLDGLFNNGAMGLPGPVEDIPTEGLREIFEVNFFGQHELTRRVIPVMRAQGSGRIVFTSSVLGFIVYKWRGAYNASKFALEGLVQTLRIEMRDSPIRVSVIQPGPIQTNIIAKAGPQFDKWVDWENSARAEQYRDELLAKLYDPRPPTLFTRPPEAVAKLLAHALEARNPRPNYMITVPTRVSNVLKRVMPVRLHDWLLSKA